MFSGQHKGNTALENCGRPKRMGNDDEAYGHSRLSINDDPNISRREKALDMIKVGSHKSRLSPRTMQSSHTPQMVSLGVINAADFYCFMKNMLSCLIDSS